MTGLTIRAFSISSDLWVLENVLSIDIDTVPIKSVTARYGGWLSSKLVNVVSGVPQGSVLDLSLFHLYTSKIFSILENKLIGYADGSTVAPSPGVRVTVAESLIRDLGRVSEWCDLCGMK